MKKIITALDGLKLSQSAIDYTIFIANKSKAHTVAVFLDDMNYHGYRYTELADEQGKLSDNRRRELNDRDRAIRDESIKVLQTAWDHAGLQYTIHRDRNVALQELLHETVYADLLIIDSNDKFNIYESESSNYFLRELLADIECPVLIVPPFYYPVQKLVMLYDGAPCSVYAIKMFNYLLPEFQFLETEVLSVRKKDENLHVPDNRLIKEFMKRHLPHADYIVLKGDPEDLITDHLSQMDENAMVILGAYRRSRVSRWFKESMADEIMKKVKIPLFIAHNK